MPRLLLLLSLFVLTGCDFGDPNEIAIRTEAALRPYFPRASAVVQPERATVYGMACVDLGRKLVEQIAPALAASPDVKRFRTLRSIGWLPGNHSYRYFVVGFEKQFVVYDVDSGDVRVRDAEGDYSSLYYEKCAAHELRSGLSSPAPGQ
jgi:hypothetical protein